MRYSKFLYRLFSGASLAIAGLLFLVSGNVASAGDCPAATVADMKGVSAGKYPQQFELSEFEANAGCTLTCPMHPCTL